MGIIIMPMPMATNASQYSGDMTSKELGYVFLISAMLIIWFFFWGWVAIEKDKSLLALICGFILPLIIGGLILII